MRSQQDAAAGGDQVHVYAIVHSGHPLPSVHGVGRPAAPLRMSEAHGLAAVLSQAPARLLPRRRDLLAHQAVLLALAEHGPVLPMRFGTLAPHDAAIQDRLMAEREHYLTVLRALADRVEINLKAMPAAEGLGGLLRNDPQLRQYREQALRRPDYMSNLRLGEAAFRASWRQATEAGQRIAGELAALAHASRPGPDVAGCALNMSFLVDRGTQARFQRAARRLAGKWRGRVDLRIFGPLPCYSFVELPSS